MKKKVIVSVESKFSTTKWKTIVPPVANLHTIKKDLLYYLEHEVLSGISGSYDQLMVVHLQLIVDGKAWNLSSFELKNLYNRAQFNESANTIFQEMERIMDLHEAFYGH